MDRSVTTSTGLPRNSWRAARRAAAVEQAPARFEVDQEVDVAVLAGLSAGGRAEHAHVAGAVLGREAQDLLSLPLQKLIDPHAPALPAAARRMPHEA